MEYLTREDLKIFRNMVDKEITNLKKQYNQHLEFGDIEREKILESLEEKEDLSLRITKELIQMPEEYQRNPEVRTFDDEMSND